MTFDLQKRLAVLGTLVGSVALVWLWPAALIYAVVLLFLAVCYQGLLLYLAARFDPKDPERRADDTSQPKPVPNPEDRPA